MSRPIGSKNKPKNGNGLQVLKFEKQIEGAPITNYNAQYNIINFGKDNQYPYKPLIYLTTKQFISMPKKWQK